MPATYFGTGEAKERFRFWLNNPPSAISIDVETVSLDDRTPLGFAVGFSPYESIYFDISGELPRELELLIPILKDMRILKIGHNLMFDLGVFPLIPVVGHVLERSNIFDTNVAARLLGKIEAALYMVGAEINMYTRPISEILKENSCKNNRQLIVKDPMILAEHCALDAKVAYSLYLDYKDKIQSQYGAYFNVEMEALPIVLDISLHGLKIDQAKRAELAAQYQKDIDFYSSHIQSFGISKPTSPAQIGYTLAERGSFLKFTKSRKQYSTRESELQFLSDPLAASVLNFREKFKFKSTYLDPLEGQDRFFCLHPDTKVLKADLSWSRIADMIPGDEIISVPFDDNGKHLKMVRDEVERVEFLSAPAYKITTQYGSMIANGEHPWLLVARKNYTKAQWIRTDKLAVGDRIKYVVSPWSKAEDTWGSGWLSAIADAEGYASNAHVGICQKPGDLWEFILFMLSEEGFGFYTVDSNRVHKEMTARFNMTESMRFLGMIRPRRLLSNAHKVWENRRPIGFEPAEILSIEDVGVQPLVNMVTGTHTFIAEGAVTHNTEYYFDTSVGRMSSRRRDIQNIPLPARAMFLPDSGTFTTGDYSREHLYILAHMSQDREMLKVLYDEDKKKSDLHQHTADKMGVPRSLAKTLNFAVAYGATAQTVRDHAKIRDLSRCQRLIDDWFKAYRGVADWVVEAQRIGRKDGWALPTVFGRRIRIPEEDTDDSRDRKAVNYPILGSDGEVIKRAIILCTKRGLGPPPVATPMVITVHDSITWDGAVEDRLPVRELEAIPGFRVPFEVKQTARWE